MEKLIEELNQLINVADVYRGVHSRVVEKGIYSENAIVKHKKGTQLLANKQKILRLIKAYKIEIKKVQNKINQIEVS